MKFYRVGQSPHGGSMWYDKDGNFVELYNNTEFDFIDKSKIPAMPFCNETAGFLSVCDNIDDIYLWWNKDYYHALEALGFRVWVYEGVTAKWYDKFKHHLIPVGTEPSDSFKLTDLL